VRLSAVVVAAFVRNNKMAPAAVPELIPSVHAAFAKLCKPAPRARAPRRPRPAVPIAISVQRDHIICLEDGKKVKSLTRYIRARFGLSPDQYRGKWGLPPDYPMVSPVCAGRHLLEALRPDSTANDAAAPQTNGGAIPLERFGAVYELKAVMSGDVNSGTARKPVSPNV
jgi:predicted transcriptional regulator